MKKWNAKNVMNTLPERKTDAHKGTYGTALIAAGSRFMPGAAVLSAIACMRSGVGKLEVGTEESVIPYIIQHLPETTFVPGFYERLESLSFDQYRVLAAGPGREADDETEQTVKTFLSTNLPVILDAGALSKRTYSKRKAPTILTPHPGEFLRISGCSKEELEENRQVTVTEFAKESGVTVVLKGKKTLTAFPDGEIYENTTGNSALSKGGTGDTLTGMITGMICCHEDWKHAILNAVYLHGASADEWIKKKSAHAMLAREINDLLPEVWKNFEKK
ncbi:NAD(P)H-hydrate dehydratase [Jeotgalibacillus haloalkalitolerans]|uniref:ADP-dependent (S)-NAD(P)H-hydrate dehydratase n=1 Tax=Jeotgalibacillus haloalkalitolerans TaxID=3104292 RepID=A0ABU5KR77_9BACL|nr:NAD(P)H-hydrate dehydratase [Jeotgalibacillus sp. HH7-29]MDZ5713456.1 NAD(P)H-hydrate dehydratase [Jeotgalibacillus sp. HH7-29]